MKSTLLIFDDDAQTVKFLEALLSQDYQLRSFRCSGENPVERTKEITPALILLDSFEFCKKLKENPDTQAIPVIVISSKNTPSEITQGLSLGAEDFLPKPFDHKVLQLRIKSHLKNVKAVQQIRMVQVGKLEIDTVDRSAKYNGAPMNLTLTEYDILRLLASRVGSVVSREEIMKVIWKDSATETTDRTIDVHIRSLRKKVPEFSDHIKSVYGVGYQYLE